jgi:hypothetical protein
MAATESSFVDPLAFEQIESTWLARVASWLYAGIHSALAVGFVCVVPGLVYTAILCIRGSVSWRDGLLGPAITGGFSSGLMLVVWLGTGLLAWRHGRLSYALLDPAGGRRKSRVRRVHDAVVRWQHQRQAASEGEKT